MAGSKMAPAGSRKETVSLKLNVMFSLARYLVLNGGKREREREREAVVLRYSVVLEERRLSFKT